MLRVAGEEEDLVVFCESSDGLDGDIRVERVRDDLTGMASRSLTLQVGM
jgi:hypothetical protein